MKYSRLAGHYNLIEKLTIGPALQKARIGQLRRLSKLANVRDVLIVGEGNGSFLAHFTRIFPKATVTVIEQSEAMIDQAKARLARAQLTANTVEFIVEDVQRVSLQAKQYDLIVTHFFFDNFDNGVVRECIEQLTPSLRQHGYWLVSDFSIPSHGWKRMRARCWLKILYLFFGWVAAIPARRLPAVELYMLETYDLVARESYCAELLFSALYRLQFNTRGNC
jgi:ubiquinone/menaquinone biosynthesis C-methylase UbiE